VLEAAELPGEFELGWPEICKFEDLFEFRMVFYFGEAEAEEEEEPRQGKD
jgi:hypothetical protein